jgi:hypothetical protein
VPVDELPLRWSIQADPRVPGMSSEQVIGDLTTMMQAWADASCGVQIEFAGERTYDDPNQAPPGELHLVFASLGQNGVPWVRLGGAGAGEVLYDRDGRTYRREPLGAYAINTDFPLASDDAIAEGTCDGRFALSLVAGALVGQRLGLGASFEDGALMSARLRPCTTVRPTEDETEGLDSLYGPWVGFACASADPGFEVGDEVAGVVPFDVDCDIDADPRSAVSDARWSWGDGTSSRGLPVTHRYERTGNHTLRAVVSGAHETCGSFELTRERFGYVRACGPPIVEFSIERYRGLIFQTRNDSNVQTFGCHTSVEWRAFDRAGTRVLAVQAWEPQLAFPENGEYRVELEVSGPGGTAVESVLLDTRKGSVRGYTLGNGCATAPGAPLWLGALALLLVGRRRA